MGKIKANSGRGPFVRRSELTSGPSAAMKRSPATNDEFAKIWVRNNTGAARMPFEVVQLGDAVIDPTISDEAKASYYSRVAVEVVEIDEDDTSKVAILLQPLADQEGGRALASGVGVARLTGDTGKTRATTVSGEYALEASDSGPFELLYDPGPADEERIAYVRFGGSAGGSGGTSGSSECECGGCIAAGAISDCTAIGDAPTTWGLDMPTELVTAFGATVALTHVSGCTWESDAFEDVDIGSGSHDYTWRLVFSGKGIEEAVVTLEDET